VSDVGIWSCVAAQMTKRDPANKTPQPWMISANKSLGKRFPRAEIYRVIYRVSYRVILITGRTIGGGYTSTSHGRPSEGAAIDGSVIYGSFFHFILQIQISVQRRFFCSHTTASKQTPTNDIIEKCRLRSIPGLRLLSWSLLFSPKQRAGKALLIFPPCLIDGL
jgi:hypothetical protein